MATEANALLILSIANGGDRLSCRDLIVALAYHYCTAAGYSTGQLALNAAITNGWDKLSDDDLDEVVAYLIGY